MKKIITLAIILILSMVTLAVADGNVSLLVGSKYLDEDWTPVDEQTELGVEADFSMNEKTNLYFTAGILVSAASENIYLTDGYNYYEGTLTCNTSEIYAGFKTIYTINDFIHPYIGAGLSVVSASLGFDDYSTDATGIGAWFSGGVYFSINEHLNLGVNLRYSKADVDFDGIELDAGGMHVNALIGYHF